jgi:type IV pilus assembly protein PilE
MLTLRTRITDHRGFSLIELMVTMAIIGILSAMAMPSYATLRKRFYDATALSDVENAGKAMEALDTKDVFTISVLGPAAIKQLPGPRVSKGTTLTLTRAADKNGNFTYQISGTSSGGTGATYIFSGGRIYATGANL